MQVKKVKTDVVINNYLDSETGEIIETTQDIKHHKIIVEDKESFAIQYSNILGALKKLTGRDIKLLTYCSLNAEQNTNRINLTKPILEEISELFDSTYDGLRQSIVFLKKQNILIPLGSGTYRINPRYYWRGNLGERLKTMKFVLEVECKNC